MNNKWILLIFPMSLTIIAMTASGQMSQLSKAKVGSDKQQPNNQGILPDTTIAPVPTDSASANPHSGWHTAPGQMPIYYFALPPNSMPNLIPPPVDEKMIIPIRSEDADSLKQSNQEDE